MHYVHHLMRSHRENHVPRAMHHQTPKYRSYHPTQNHQLTL